jgi:hypothetical protein
VLAVGFGENKQKGINEGGYYKSYPASTIRFFCIIAHYLFISSPWTLIFI